MHVLAWVALIIGLVMPTLAPGTANIGTLVLMGIGLLWLLARGGHRAILMQPAVWITLLAGAVLLLALIPTASSVQHIGAILILAPMWFVAAHSGLLRELAQRLTPSSIGCFALLGAASGAAVAATDVLVLGQDRGGGMVNNPIHHADITLVLGFVALVGVTSGSRRSLVFLLGPVLALVTIWFSGSRGPLLAFAPMLALGGGVLAVLLLPRRHAALVIGTGALVVCLGSYGMVSSGAAGRLAGVTEIGAVFTGTSADASATERLDMLHSATNAFWASPIHGHGIIDYTDVAESFQPAGKNYSSWGHLHNDLADFAVIGGSLGLLSYALLLLAPLIAAWKAQGRWRPAIIYLGTVTPVGYFVMGLTNAMIGILAQTTLYAVVLSLIATLSLESKDHFA